MNNKSGSIKAYLPVLLVLFLAIGILVGSRLSLFRAKPGNSGDGRKIDEIMAYILDNYVDTVNKEAMNTAAIKGLLESLDPHSDYITPESYHDVVDPIRGNFEGIGVQFRIVSDTIVVVLPVPGGPSEKAGIRAGDRIVSVNDQDLGKKKIKEEDVLKMLKGPKGSKVNVGIFRRGNKKLLHFTLTRDVIPTYSIDVHYMINPNTGYIKLSRFAATTAREFETSLADLKSKGMTRLILDLRGNSGGYLEAATKLADEFLPDKKMIVYTEG
jgi:carboxyl-terminal processing protease